MSIALPLASAFEPQDSPMEVLLVGDIAVADRLARQLPGAAWVLRKGEGGAWTDPDLDLAWSRARLILVGEDAHTEQQLLPRLQFFPEVAVFVGSLKPEARRGLRFLNEGAAGYFGVDETEALAEALARWLRRPVSANLESRQGLARLAGGLAHDLNNLFAPIVLAVPVLRSAVRTDQARTLLENIHQSAKSGADLVRLVLMATGELRVGTAPLAPEPVLSETRRLAQGTFPSTVFIDVLVAGDAPETEGDAEALVQALLALCRFALTGLPKGGRLRLHAEAFTLETQPTALSRPLPKGDYLLLRVEDTGPSLEAKECQKLWEPYASRLSRLEGQGLSLFAVRGLIEAQGGAVRAFPLKQGGLATEVFLPALDQRRKLLQPAEKGPKPQTQGEIILVVDDEAPIRDALRITLENRGFSVITAADGVEALVSFSRHRASILAVITDMVMPGMDGPALVRGLRHIDAQVRILGITGAGERRTRQQYEALGLPLVLAKPFPPEKIIEALEAFLLEKQSARLAPT